MSQSFSTSVSEGGGTNLDDHGFVDLLHNHNVSICEGCGHFLDCHSMFRDDVICVDGDDTVQGDATVVLLVTILCRVVAISVHDGCTLCRGAAVDRRGVLDRLLLLFFLRLHGLTDLFPIRPHFCLDAVTVLDDIRVLLCKYPKTIRKIFGFIPEMTYMYL